MKQYEGKKLMVFLTGTLLALFFFLPVGITAPMLDSGKADPIILAFNGYKITRYDVQIKVQENNSLDVTENITAQFEEPKHGIYRNIPLVHKVREPMNQETVAYTQKAKISNLLVMDGLTGQTVPINQENKSGQLALKIGDASQTFTGEKTYCIRYTYSVNSDGGKSFNELYYNLIGDGWDTYIGNVSFAIEMPKAFDPKNIVFMLGAKDAGSRVNYQVEDNRITGKVNSVLARGEGLTIRLALPQGYFRRSTDDHSSIWKGILAGLIVVSLLLFFLVGRNSRLQREGALPLPLTFTPAEAGYVLGGDAAKRGRTALLLYWADKRYLCFEKNGQDDVTLVKLKDADAGLKPYEQTLFNALFVNGDEVTAEQLKTQVAGVLSQTERELQDYFSVPERRIYTVPSSKARGVCYLLTLLGMVMFSAKIYGDVYSWTDLLTSMVLVGVWAFVLFPFILFVDYYARKNGTGEMKGLLINSIGVLLMLGVLLGLASYADALDQESWLIVAVMGVSGFCGAFMKKRTAFGNMLLSQVLRLKKQMGTGDLATWQTSEPFYSLLPYAYMFNISKEWGTLFERIELQPPEWFKGQMSDLYVALSFSNIVNEQLSLFESNMTYSESSDGSGGGGGGTGGGGGGSW